MSFQSVFDLTTLDGSNGFKLQGPTWAMAGSAVAIVDDVNGDGIADILVGARFAAGVSPYSGAGYVVFGRPSDFSANVSLDSLDGTDGFKVLGINNSLLGTSGAGVGDLNGDGLGDLAFGGPRDSSGGYIAGMTIVVFGSSGAFPATLAPADLDGTNGFTAFGTNRTNSGISVASAGDINGDGFDDLAIGADLFNTGFGRIYVIYGSASGFSGTLNLGDIDGANGFGITSLTSQNALGTAVSPLGDLNGDGVDDLLISDRADAFVLFGDPAGFGAEIAVSSLDGSNGFRIVEGNAATFDRSVALAGDVNGDGLNDFIIGDGTAAGASGSAYLVFGRTGGFGPQLDLTTLDGETGFRMDGPAGSRAGIAVGAAGDVNGDGFDDLVIGGSRAYNGYYQHGAAFVVFGRALAFDAVINLGDLDRGAGFRIPGPDMYGRLGQAVAGGGDVNGDGIDDLIVSDPYGPGGGGNGAAYVVYGQSADFTGGAGDDTVSGGAGGETYVGGGGKDSLRGFGGEDVLEGGDGNDLLSGGEDTDYLSGGLGNDSLDGGNGDDRLWDVGGTNKLNGGAGNDRLAGGSGADRLDGGADSDVLTGGAGNDYLDGGAGTNSLRGGTGNDIFIVRTVGDTVGEAVGEGIDTVRSTISYTLGDQVEGLELLSGTNLDGTGNGLANSLKGNGGDNTLSGLAGADRIDGAGGGDVLIGGTGRDTLTGGAGADTFRVLQESVGLATLEVDAVLDYSTAEDILDFSLIDANAALAGDQAFAVRTTGFSKTAGEMFVFFTAASNTTTVRLDVNGDGLADYQMAVKGNVLSDTGDWLL